MLLVLNEWVFHDLLNENGQSKFRETADFLCKFERSNDQLVFPLEQPWMVVPVEQRWRTKAYRLMRMSDPLRRQISQKFHSLMYNSDRAHIVTEEDLSDPPRASYEWVPSKDVYLVAAYDVAGADVLVTTDVPLSEAIDAHNGVNCKMRDDFLQGYHPSG